MRKRTDKLDTRGKSKAAKAALSQLHAQARERREALALRIIAEIVRRQKEDGVVWVPTYAECKELTGVSVNTVKKVVSESSRIEELRGKGRKRVFITLSY